jgi:MFS family permease
MTEPGSTPPELIRFRQWIVLILVFGLVGGAIAYFAIDAGPNRVGLGVLFGMAFGAIVPLFQVVGASYYPDEEQRRRNVERLAEKQAGQRRAREKWGDRRKAFAAVTVLGYLAGAVWNGGFLYGTWLNWMAGAYFVLTASLFLRSDPDE